MATTSARADRSTHSLPTTLAEGSGPSRGSRGSRGSYRDETTQHATDGDPFQSQTGNQPTIPRELAEDLADVDEEDDGKKLMDPHEKRLDALPWIISPVRSTEKIWIRVKDEAPEWLPLLFDLVVVAVLTVFSLQHPMSTPDDIPNFLSFFVIVFWTWVSQTAFDVRYQANDVLNRFWKFCQILLFIFTGASSGHWAPGRIRQDVEDELSSRAISHDDALQSFLVVALAFCISRSLLAVQYTTLWAQAREAKRRTRHLILTIVALVVSAALALIAVALPARNRPQHYTKLVLFYAGILVELVMMVWQVFLRFVPAVSTRRIAERYGAFGLIILGDGLLSITRAFNISISGLSDTDPNTYAQVFLVILVIFLLWVFLFSHFDKRDQTGHGRAVLWQVMHFPLSFSILIMLGAMVNVVIVLSSTAGATLVTDFIWRLLQWLLNEDPNAEIPDEEVARMARYLNRLNLQPPFPQMLEYLTDLKQNTTSEPTLQNVNPAIILIQYMGQMVYQTYQLYSSPITAEARDAFLAISVANVTLTGDDGRDRERVTTVAEVWLNMTMILSDASMSGTLWLFPAAGAVLICTALRSLLWSRLPRPLQITHHATLLISGIALMLCSLTTLGSKTIDPLGGRSLADVAAEANSSDPDAGLQLIDVNTSGLNPFYKLIVNDLPLVIVAAVYVAAWLIMSGSTWYLTRGHQRIGRRKAKRREKRRERKERRKEQRRKRVAGEERDRDVEKTAAVSRSRSD